MANLSLNSQILNKQFLQDFSALRKMANLYLRIDQVTSFQKLVPLQLNSWTFLCYFWQSFIRSFITCRWRPYHALACVTGYNRGQRDSCHMGLSKTAYSWRVHFHFNLVFPLYSFGTGWFLLADFLLYYHSFI